MASRGNAEGMVVMEALATIAVNGDPATYEEAIASVDREKWLEAIHPEVDPNLFMEVPEGWDSGNVSESGTGEAAGTGIAAGSIARLNKALYGLKQAPWLWYKDIDGILVKSLNFAQSNADPNLYSTYMDKVTCASCCSPRWMTCRSHTPAQQQPLRKGSK